MRFGTSTLHFSLLHLIAISTCLPRNQYSDSWYYPPTSGEVSRASQRIHESIQARNIPQSPQNADIQEQTRFPTPNRRVSRPEDLLVQRNRPRWYDSPGSKPTSVQQQRQIMQDLLELSSERSERLVTGQDTNLSNSVAPRGASNSESYGLQRFDSHGQTQKAYSSHENREIVNQNNRRPFNVTSPTKKTRIVPVSDRSVTGGIDIGTRFGKDEESGPSVEKPEYDKKGGLEMRIVAQRESSTKNSVQVSEETSRLYHQMSSLRPTVTKQSKNNRTQPTDSAKLPRPTKPNPPTGGDIIFPDVAPTPKFVPRHGKCRKGKIFCEDVDDEYPSDYINKVFKKEGSSFQQLFGRDLVTEPNVTQRIDMFDENPLCPSREQVVYPKVAQNNDNKWLFVVNQEPYTQGVRVEICISSDSACHFTESFPLGYRTFCKQKFISRKMVTLDEEGKPYSDYIRLPSCCSCVIKRDTTSRSGLIGPSKKTTPAIRPKEHSTS